LLTIIPLAWLAIACWLRVVALPDLVKEAFTTSYRALAVILPPAPSSINAARLSIARERLSTITFARLSKGARGRIGA
jgi:hypothetical protein